MHQVPGFGLCQGLCALLARNLQWSCQWLATMQCYCCSGWVLLACHSYALWTGVQRNCPWSTPIAFLICAFTCLSACSKWRICPWVGQLVDGEGPDAQALAKVCRSITIVENNCATLLRQAHSSEAQATNVASIGCRMLQQQQQCPPEECIAGTAQSAVWDLCARARLSKAMCPVILWEVKWYCLLTCTQPAAQDWALMVEEPFDFSDNCARTFGSLVSQTLSICRSIYMYDVCINTRKPSDSVTTAQGPLGLW
jgi:hypothetical protein